MTNEEVELELKIEALGLTGLRIEADDIDEQIKHTAFYRFPGTTMTVCLITLLNGFHVVGESACASPENFNEEIGKHLSFHKAREKIWMLEGYLLRQEMYMKEPEE